MGVANHRRCSHQEHPLVTHRLASTHRLVTHRLVTNELEPLKGIPQNIIRLSIHPSVHEIVQDAFQNCRCLTEVELHQNLKAIGENAFQHCIVLEKIEIPSSVETIGRQAFQFCNSLVEVGLSKGLKSIGVRAFEKCVKLSMTSLPSSVETIGKNAFLDCESITEFELHRGLKKVGDRVFQGCCKLQRLKVLPPMLSNTNGLCHGCNSLVDVQLPHGLQEIGAGTFAYCKLLQKVSAPSSVKIIRTKAFYSCSSLSEVELREGLECIESLVFGYCESLSTISLPSSVEVIEDQAFAYCKGLMGVEFESDMKTRLEERPFMECSSLITVSLPLECKPADLTMCMGLRPSVTSEVNDRFANFPIHAACYHASCTTVEELESILDSTDGKLEDAFEMNPFHIIATAGKLRLDLLEVLLAKYPARTISQRDRASKTMIDYLMKHRNPKVNQLKALIFETIIKDAMAGWGLGRWQRDVLSQLELVDWAPAPSGITRNRMRLIAARRHSIVDRIQHSMAGYLKMELTSILELVLWKRQGMEWLNGAEGEVSSMDRGKCRTTCGADVVIPRVAEFLWDIETASESLVSPLLQCDLEWAWGMDTR
mmetsp:Transcript_36268/g.87834  ORF Transcript_36268/g.87834 Transcript_36268/m.87834 type:complete len:597 (-) Transcript_36268:208-1998(-)